MLNRFALAGALGLALACGQSIADTMITATPIPDPNFGLRFAPSGFSLTYDDRNNDGLFEASELTGFTLIRRQHMRWYTVTSQLVGSPTIAGVSSFEVVAGINPSLCSAIGWCTWGSTLFDSTGTVPTITYYDAIDPNNLATDWSYVVTKNVAAVPEPSTLCLLLAGITVTSVALRKRSGNHSKRRGGISC